MKITRRAADGLRCRLARLFLRDAEGRRSCHGEDPRYAEDPHWRDLLLFHEYFHGGTGRGLGASAASLMRHAVGLQ